MAFDQATRNRLSKFVTDTRKLLSDEFSQQMRVKYGLDPATGVVTDISKLPTMGEGDRQTAQLLRDTLEHYLASSPKRDKKAIASTIDRIVREQAFTVLNRICAVRMAEARELVIESIAQGTKSKGFQLYSRLAGSALGETVEAYVCYLFSLFDELSIDLPVLFDRFSPSGRLFPKESVFLGVLEQINHHELQCLWAEDETIGWIYQYFNSQEERRAMRDESSAPRNSRELAVRNQFFTPRYVVEFLTDNTLGLIWYEMTQGKTRLVDDCKYLVRRLDEVFLSHMTSKDQEQPSYGTITMAELLLSGTEETFPEFNARNPQPMIELAHCVSAYATMGDRAHEIPGNRTLIVRERSVHEPSEIADAVQAAPYVFAGQPGMLKTQHILEVLFITCRSDRHGGVGSVYSEPWFVDACNEVRSRVLNSRRDDLSQEELLRQPVFIPYRPMKDPRDIKMLDPACGSMHFGLYAFDLFLHIYKEAWELEERLGDQAFVRARELKSLRNTYGTRERYMLDVPRLIIECNIHGIDIDSRAVQIAGLSLWLRAQKAWHEAGIKPAARPQITRSNIVCAEPMPGESDLLEQFISDHLSQTSEQQTIASIVRRVFDAMKLAGEAGSLLKIEEEIAGTIAEAKKKWIEGPTALQLPLFAIDAKQKDAGARPLLVAGIDGASFWDEIEERIYRALKSYAVEATSDGGFQRRLFAEDAARGFAFIDVCRKRYDVVVMNPPFGQASTGIEGKLGDKSLDFAAGKNLAWAFVQRSVQLQTERGLTGAIVDRTIFQKSSYEVFRSDFILPRHMPAYVDLGSEVLDANVFTCGFVIEATTGEGNSFIVDLRSIAAEQKGEALASIVRHARDGSLGDFQLRDTKEFSVVPFVSFAHWIDQKTLNSVFAEKTVEDCGFEAGSGLQCNDVFRFLRCRWEVPLIRIKDNSWRGIYNGVDYSKHHTTLVELVNWAGNGAEIKANIIRLGHSPSRHVVNESFYFKEGLAGGKRGEFFDVHILPSGFIFSNEGRVFLGKDRSQLLFLLGYLNTLFAQQLVNIFCGQHKGANYLKKVPIPHSVRERFSQIGDAVTQIVSTKTQVESLDEVSPRFLARIPNSSSSDPFPTLKKLCDSLTEKLSQQVTTMQQTSERIDTIIADALGIESVNGVVESGWVEAPPPKDNLANVSPNGRSSFSRSGFVDSLISLSFGAAFGRWDIRYATGEQAAPELPDPFAPLPVCPPGQLQNAQGLPARPEDVPAAYPVRIPWDGILVDDPNHPLDLERRVHEVIEIIWKDRTEAIEHEACEILGVKSVRDHFRKPADFFADHLKRYSKSRRQAPIYWPLSTDSGNYTLWLYYQRLTDQTLYTAVNDFVEPKQKQINDDLKALRTKTNRSKVDEDELERLSALSIELEDFRKELRRIADFWTPNLNDGVQITAAPLWKFFRLKKWRDTLKKTWDELEEGEYDWAHLALSIWPDRVVRTAHKDRSIAIAHSLEDVLWHEVEIKKSSKTGRMTVKHEWQPRDHSEKELDAIVARVKSGEIGTVSVSPAEVANG